MVGVDGWSQLQIRNLEAEKASLEVELKAVRLPNKERLMDLAERLRIALERAAQEGRNVVPDASDGEAHLIESFAAHLLIAVELAQEDATNAYLLGDADD